MGYSHADVGRQDNESTQIGKLKFCARGCWW